MVINWKDDRIKINQESRGQISGGMTLYLIKLTYVPIPFVIDTLVYSSSKLNGLYFAWFREFNEWEWIKKL